MTRVKKTPMPRNARPALPGAPAENETRNARMIRVDHAGEFGARRIYEGQLAVLSRDPASADDVKAIRHMAAQEEKHYASFDALVKARGVRPTALEPIWNVAGFALGAATALLGPKAAMACTVAVEDAIDAHYAEQIAELDAASDKDPELQDTIARFRDEEREHREEALSRGAEEAPGYPLLSAAIRFGCRVAIKLSERI